MIHFGTRTLAATIPPKKGKWSILTTVIFYKGVEITNQLLFVVWFEKGF